MKLYRLVQQNFAVLGIVPDHSSQNLNPFNLKIWISLLVFVLSSIFCYVSLFYDTRNFQEYIEILVVVSSTTASLASFASTVLQRKLLFKHIKNCERIVNKSKKIFLLNVFSRIVCLKKKRIQTLQGNRLIHHLEYFTKESTAK